jgi:hypothetical protein
MSELEVRVVCCYSRRTCREYYTGVIDIYEKSLTIYNATRCYRGEVKILRITEPERYIVFNDLVSYRGNHNIHVIHKPSTMSEEEALKLVKRIIGLIKEEVI